MSNSAWSALARSVTIFTNWSSGESYTLTSTPWLTAGELAKALASPEAQRRSGDVYAVLEDR